MTHPTPFPHASYVVTTIEATKENPDYRGSITFLRDAHKHHLLTGTYTTPNGATVEILLEGADDTPTGIIVQSAAHHGPFHFVVNAAHVPQSLPLTFMADNRHLLLMLVPLRPDTPQDPAIVILYAVTYPLKTGDSETELRRSYDIIAQSYHHVTLDCTPAGKYPPEGHKVYRTVDALFADPVWRKAVDLDVPAPEPA